MFGIERNSDACHLAAFSLYLTMLDYIDPREIMWIAKGDAAQKLFPRLVGSNLLAEDFFADCASFPGVPDRVRCVVGSNRPRAKNGATGKNRAVPSEITRPRNYSPGR